MMQKEFNLYPELHDQLMKQLFFYTCYMVDNMLTPHLNIEDLFIKKEFKKQIRIIKESSIGNSLLIYKKQYQTSSRMRRIIDMIEHPNIINVLNLYLFRKYEVHNSRT